LCPVRLRGTGPPFRMTLMGPLRHAPCPRNPGTLPGVLRLTARTARLQWPEWRLHRGASGELGQAGLRGSDASRGDPFT
jgi:hypothetical protein